MSEKLLICLSAEEVTAAHWRARRIADCRVFRNDDAGFAEFEEFLLDFAGIPTYIMVDAVEEDYRFETLPHAFGSDRGEMVRRKLRQHYRNIPYVNACFLGRETGRRRDDRYLFSALTNPELIGGWLQAVVAKGLPIAGIFLLPMVSPALVSALPDLPLEGLEGTGFAIGIHEAEEVWNDAFRGHVDTGVLGCQLLPHAVDDLAHFGVGWRAAGEPRREARARVRKENVVDERHRRRRALDVEQHDADACGAQPHAHGRECASGAT